MPTWWSFLYKTYVRYEQVIVPFRPPPSWLKSMPKSPRDERRELSDLLGKDKLQQLKETRLEHSANPVLQQHYTSVCIIEAILAYFPLPPSLPLFSGGEPTIFAPPSLLPPFSTFVLGDKTGRGGRNPCYVWREFGGGDETTGLVDLQIAAAAEK